LAKQPHDINTFPVAIFFTVTYDNQIILFIRGISSTLYEFSEKWIRNILDNHANRVLLPFVIRIGMSPESVSLQELETKILTKNAGSIFFIQISNYGCFLFQQV